MGYRDERGEGLSKLFAIEALSSFTSHHPSFDCVARHRPRSLLRSLAFHPESSNARVSWLSAYHLSYMYRRDCIGVLPLNTSFENFPDLTTYLSSEVVADCTLIGAGVSPKICSGSSCFIVQSFGFTMNCSWWSSSAPTIFNIHYNKSGKKNLDTFDRYVMNYIPIHPIRLSDMKFVGRNDVRKHFRDSVPKCKRAPHPALRIPDKSVGCILVRSAGRQKTCQPTSRKSLLRSMCLARQTVLVEVNFPNIPSDSYMHTKDEYLEIVYL
ncbi:hypothetical protein K503DRAFT_785670 [Rhizopogon vinicolor AM-OR11-026]|uniref:Uncharacterized protein n=1 Tax=Rhizopogon vinicolor AM-OR11-026 TaxID=1314800 RepID=A0A1B7MPN7_9AGAM|nr:hypothetical protein K503DRAFT_785670 [Rhizopogon vinicolor AM-OR11-026]